MQVIKLHTKKEQLREHVLLWHVLQLIICKRFWLHTGLNYMRRPKKKRGRSRLPRKIHPNLVNSHGKKINGSINELSEYQRYLSYIVQISVQQICTCINFGKTGLFRCQSRQGHNKAVGCANVLIPRCVFISLWGRHIGIWVPHSHLFSITYSECLDFYTFGKG